MIYALEKIDTKLWVKPISQSKKEPYGETRTAAAYPKLGRSLVKRDVDNFHHEFI